MPEKTRENLLSPEEDLELQRGNLVNESTNETSGSCDFDTDNLIVFTGDAKDSPSLGIVLEEEELLQKEGEIVMFHM